MAGLVGKFTADFGAFYDAVEKADVKLKGLESSASKVAGSVNRVADSFSGQRILQQANIAVKAVESIGGASKLTESEQRRLNATLSEAVEKYRALGEKAPKAMIDLERATRAVSESTGGLSGRMVAVAASIGTLVGNLATDAVRALGRELVEIGSNGIKLAPVVDAFQKLTAGINQSSEAMLGATRSATKGLITDLDIMAASNKAILLGLPVTANEMGVLGTAAVALGRAMKQDAGKSLDDLITALGRSSPLILDNLGLTVKVGEANAQFAAQLGKAADALSPAEQKLAFYNAAMDAAKAKVETLGGVQLTLADQVTRASNVFKNFTDALGVAIARSPVLNAALGGMADGMTKAFGGNQVKMVQDLIGYVNNFGIKLVDVAQLGLSAASVMGKGWAVLQLAFSATASIITSVGLAFANLVAGAAELATKIPGLGDKFLGVAASARSMANFMGGVQKSFHDQATEALESIKGHSAFQSTLDRVSSSLSSMRTAMVAASRTQADSSAIAADLTKNLGAVADETGKAAVQSGVAAAAFATMRDAAADTLESTQRYLGTFITKMAKAREEIDAFGRYWYSGVLKNTGTGLIAKLIEWPSDAAGHTTAQAGALGKSVADGVGKPVVEATHHLSDMAAAFTMLSQTAGGKFAEISREIGTVITAMNLAAEAGRKMKDAIASFSDGKMAQGIAQSATSIASGAASVWQATESGGTWSRVGKGAMAGMEYGDKTSIPGGGLIGAGVGALVGWARTVGAPSGKELTGRGMTDQFTQQLASVLDWQKQIEVHQAVAAGASAKWATQVVAVRDAYTKAGHSVQEAESFVNRLWEAEKKGGPAVQALLDEFAKATHDTLPYFQQKTKDALDEWQKLIDAGTPEIVALRQVKSEYISLAETAVEAGEGIPEALKPTLLRLAQIGEITDEDAKKLLGLSDAAGPSFKDMEAAAGRYGIKLDDIGDKYKALKLQDTTKQLTKDWESLVTDGGAPAREVLAGMADDINDVIKTSQRFGIDIPEDMKPVIQAAIDYGYATDANGQKLTDLSQLNWAAPIETATQRLIDQLAAPDGLLDNVTRLHNELVDLPNIDRTVTYHYQSDGGPPSGGGSDVGMDVPGFAGGTRGQYLNFGAGTLAMLHGREKVVTASEGARDASALSAVLDQVRAQGQQIGSLVRELPRMIAANMALALAGTGR
jgi:hypothetical protein